MSVKSADRHKNHSVASEPLRHKTRLHIASVPTARAISRSKSYRRFQTLGAPLSKKSRRSQATQHVEIEKGRILPFPI